MCQIAVSHCKTMSTFTQTPIMYRLSDKKGDLKTQKPCCSSSENFNGNLRAKVL